MKSIENVLIIGATSAIAQAVAREYAAEGARLHLVARNKVQLEAIAQDLRVRGANSVSVAQFDVRDTERVSEVVEDAFAALGQADLALVAHGTLPDQKACEKDLHQAREAFEVNAVSVIGLLTELATRFEQQASGTIAVISSVAGDRGRGSNYVYGAAKAAVSTFVGGLAQRMHAHGVQVLCIKPGFVDTPMTKDFAKGPLWATPESIGKGIYKAVSKRLDTVYLPRFWWLIMLVIRNLPNFVLKRANL